MEHYQVQGRLEENCLAVSGITASRGRAGVIIHESRRSSAQAVDYLLKINGMSVDHMSNRTIADLLSTPGARIETAGNPRLQILQRYVSSHRSE